MEAAEGSLEDRFRIRRQEGRKALIPYVTAGYPDRHSSPAVLDAVVEAGGDIIELGIPFSDPLADGPTIQRASFQALAGGTTVHGVLEILREFRERHDTPVVLFTYLNPVLRYGLEIFLRDARAAGAQGLLVTDLPRGGDGALEDVVAGSGLDLIRLVAPTTSPERIREIAAGARGFLYYISRTGVTGARSSVREELAAEVEVVRSLVDLPVAVGFGISRPADARLVARVADGVVVGSALIEAMEAGGPEGGRAFLASLRTAVDGASG